MAVPAIETEGLTKRYGGDILALDGLDLRIDPGTITGFLGPNGAGKTTTIRLLLDLIRPSAGRAAIFGHDCQRDSIAARALTGYLAGDLHLYENLSAAELFALVARLRRRPVDWPRVHELARRLDLDTGRKLAALSKGNRQKVGVILPLLDRPPLLLLDEPASGLDPLVQHEVWAILREEAANGTCVFFSSHVMSEVEAICERVAILRRGRLVGLEPIEHLKGRSVRHVTVVFAGGGAAPELAPIEGVRVLDRLDGRLRLEVHDNMNALVRELARYEIADLESEPPSLDEVIRSYYEEPAT